MLRLALLILLPLAHAVRVVTPFRSAPVRMAASLPSVDPALKLVLRAAGDRGKADLSSLRALAGLIGMDDGLRALEEQLGISGGGGGAGGGGRLRRGGGRAGGGTTPRA